MVKRSKSRQFDFQSIIKKFLNTNNVDYNFL